MTPFVAVYLSRAIDELVAQRSWLQQEQARVEQAIDVMRKHLESVSGANRN